MRGTRSTILMAVMAAVAAGCGGGSGGRTTLGNSGGGAATSLAAALARDVGGGQPVAIVGGAAGLRAISADGAREQVLVARPVAWVLVDNRAGVVWFGDDGFDRIEVLDLESAADQPVLRTAVSGLPTETDAGAPLVTISYPDPGADIPIGDEISIGHPITPHVVLHVSPTPSLGAAGGILEMWEQQAEFEAKVQEATIVEPGLIAELARRGAGRALSAPRSTAEHRVDLADYSACDDADYCGRAEEVTPSLWRVVTSFSCGDGCYTGWQLYDPAAKKLLDAGWAQEIGSAWLSPDARAFIAGGQVIRFDGGPLATTPPAGEGGGGLGGGWLGGGTYLP